jgi:phenylacetate-CoA oxygenase PaaI subunit
VTEESKYSKAADLPEELREHLGALILVLADNKRLLGMRYSDWILGAPALEAGIACSAMAQDEWGHGRIFYAMLRDFGQDPNQLEHGRGSNEYRSSELLDGPADGWTDLLALNLLLDSALSVQFEAMAESRFEPVHYKVSKLLDEERFHFEHGRGWVARLGSTQSGREAMQRAFAPAWEACVRWFGPDDDEAARALCDGGLTDKDAAGLRERWLQRVAPVVESVSLGLAEADGGAWRSKVEPAWDGWDSGLRRGREGGPDADTLVRVRGDKNRPLLMD